MILDPSVHPFIIIQVLISPSSLASLGYASVSVLRPSTLPLLCSAMPATLLCLPFISFLSFLLNLSYARVRGLGCKVRGPPRNCEDSVFWSRDCYQSGIRYTDGCVRALLGGRAREARASTLVPFSVRV